MPFETRCPECSAKLRLDDAPEKGAMIECAKCGSLFIPPKASAGKKDAAPVKEEKSRAPKKPKSIKVDGTKNPNNKGVNRKVKKKRTNPVFLLAAIGFGFAGLTGVFFTMIFFMGRAGAVEEMLTYVPGEANWVRGLNLGTLAKYPGYVSEVKKFKTDAVESAAAHLAKAAGQDEAGFLDYLIIAKQRQDANTTGTMYVFHTAKNLKIETLAAGMSPGTETAVGAEKAFKFGASGPGILANATVIVPAKRIIVIIPQSKLSATMVTASIAGKADKTASFAGKLNITGKTIIRGSIWLLMKNNAFLKNYMEVSMGVVDQDFKALYDKSKSSEMFGVWTSPGGGGVRVGAGFQCVDKAAAYEVVRAMKDGPLGKGDESEPTNQMKKASLQFVSDKRAFGEFMQSLEFRTNRECAYIVATVTGDSSKKFMDAFNSVSIGSDEGSSFNGGGGGGGNTAPPGGRGGPGLPGGIAGPGMGQ
jgi:predicted nucleic acid-binding Zn ribbon protein